MSLFLLLVLAILDACLPSCADSREPFTFDVDETMPFDGQALVVEAMGKWCSVTRPGFCPSIDGGHWRVANAAPPAPCPANIVGCTTFDDRIVWITPGLSSAAMRVAALHELGHVIGLLHTCVSARADFSSAYPEAPPCAPGKSLGAMDPDNGGSELSDVDKTECRRVGACDP